MSAVIRIRIELAYEGIDFAGWAVQPALRTVQGTLEEALGRVLRVEQLRVIVAGRTDAGVHARAQVVHFDVPVDAWLRSPGRSDRSPDEALMSRLNRVLPHDVVVLRVEPAAPGFDARFSAVSRRYSYRIADRVRTRDPLRRRSVMWSKHELDVDAMQAAAQQLLGLRDFAAFCKPRPGASTIRELQEFDWTREEDGPDQGLVVGRIRSDAFCHNMVRALVGASLAVGTSKRPPQWPAEMMEARVRHPGIVVVAAHGLTLEEVSYPPDAELATRAEKIRARRLDEEVPGS